ncbi:arginine deiminase family protein [Peribacillus butanolivorans]|uniref:arginine deiminase family protein n=1 Tax=Peribacillus butanolivorans TaxID=421767 RepID=UPI0035D58D26
MQKSEEFPDSTFVEDAAVLTPEFAVITNPGADTRNGEIVEIESVLKDFYEKFHYIKTPGTLDGGDILQIENHFYIGISERTKEEGARQLKEIVESEGYQATIVPLQKFFHLKTGIAYLGNNAIIVAGEFINPPEFDQYKKIIVPEEEEYTANCILVNGSLINRKDMRRQSDKLKRQAIKQLN